MSTQPNPTPSPSANPNPAATPAGLTQNLTAEQKVSFLQNEIDWSSGMLTKVGRALEMPADWTMARLEEHAKNVMAELKTLRAKVRQ